MEHYSKCEGIKLLESLAKRGTTVNRGGARFRFRKPSLYPAELRDRRPARRGRFENSIPERRGDRQLLRTALPVLA